MTWVSIASDNGLSPVRRQAITWTNAGLLSIGPLERNVCEIRIKYKSFIQENAVDNVVCEVAASVFGADEFKESGGRMDIVSLFTASDDFLSSCQLFLFHAVASLRAGYASIVRKNICCRNAYLFHTNCYKCLSMTTYLQFRFLWDQFTSCFIHHLNYFCCLCDDYIIRSVGIIEIVILSQSISWGLLLTWINFDPSMDE